MTRLLKLLWLVPAWTLSAQAAGFDATVHWARRVELGLPVSGVLKSVEAQAGAVVKRGQRLLALDDAPFKAAVERAEAEVVRARLDREEAQRDYEQAQELYDRKVLSTVELENARNRSARAAAAHRAALARLAQAQYDLRHSVLAAPFDGWVLEVRVRPGESVISTLESRVLVVLAAGGEYEARTLVTADVINTLWVGQPASVKAAGKTYAGTVRLLGLEPAAEKGGRAQYELRVAFSAPEPLRAGTPARIELD